ncbi:MAG: flippase-like domain-containing protein [Fibromonadales bacterium]|nr:flippase-like domain-containing protein [Fibromonadales bacterium]
MKNFAIFLVKLLVSAVLCFFVWQSIASTPGMNSYNFSAIMRNLDYKYLVFALFCIFLSYFSGCFQWKLLLATQNVKMTYVNLLRFYFVGSFFNNFMPGNVGGDLKKIYDINQNSEETVGAAISATVLDRLCGLYMLCAFALAVGVAFFWKDPNQKYFLLPSLLIFIGFSVAIGMLFSRRFGNLVFGKVFSFLGERVLHLHRRFQAFRTNKLLSQLFFLSVVTQSLRVLSHYFCALSIGVDIDVSWYFYYIPLVAIVSALPISIGGFGPREFLAQSLFARVGVGSMEAVLMQFLAYLANLVVSLIGFADFLFRQKH